MSSPFQTHTENSGFWKNFKSLHKHPDLDFLSQRFILKLFLFSLAMAQGYTRLWNESQKSLLITVSLSCIMAVTISITYGFDPTFDGSSQSSFLLQKGSRSHTAAMKAQRLAWARDAAFSDAHHPTSNLIRSISIKSGYIYHSDFQKLMLLSKFL